MVSEKLVAGISESEPCISELWTPRRCISLMAMHFMHFTTLLHLIHNYEVV